MEIIIFFVGGLSYTLIEIIFRGYSHWSMFVTGGAVVLTFYFLLPVIIKLNTFVAALLGALIITAYEFVVGIVVNKLFEWNIWDYSDMPFNLLGQICPQYSAYWFLICLVFFGLIKYNKGIFF